MDSSVNKQKKICGEYAAVYEAADASMLVGIASETVKNKLKPINGLRHPLGYDTSGWYIWAGQEFSDKEDFFKPLHVSHLMNRCPEVVPYLGLPPVWRFLIDGDYIDVWFDEELLTAKA